MRVLRVARFAARFASLGFEVAAQTRALMQAMAANGEIPSFKVANAVRFDPHEIAGWLTEKYPARGVEVRFALAKRA